MVSSRHSNRADQDGWDEFIRSAGEITSTSIGTSSSDPLTRLPDPPPRSLLGSEIHEEEDSCLILSASCPRAVRETPLFHAIPDYPKLPTVGRPMMRKAP